MSFSEMVANTARQKAEAARARAKGTPPRAERPHDVFLAACEQIANGLVPYGYAWKRRLRAATREAGDFRFQVSFQTSRNNVAGTLVVIWIHADVLSPRMQKWREVQLAEGDPTEYVAGGQIGNLLPEQPWMEWNVADHTKRQAAITDAIDAIETIAFPYFARFENPPIVVGALQHSELPAMDVVPAVEFLHCFADEQSAEQAGKAFLRNNPRLVRRYKREVLRPTPNPVGGGTYAHRLAALARKLGLDFTP